MRVGTDGNVYDHEVGFAYTGASAPFLESGPLELGEGDSVIKALRLIPDELTQGDVNAEFKTKFFPNGPETIYGPYTMSEPTDFRWTARQAKVRFTGVNMDDWRIGDFRLDVKQGGRR
jgi:hypothetical protein